MMNAPLRFEPYLRPMVWGGRRLGEVLGKELPTAEPYGDPRRGWDFRAPGRGGIDWEAVVRALNDAGYDGPLAVEWKDPGMSRDHGAAEACQFVRVNAERPELKRFAGIVGRVVTVNRNNKAVVDFQDGGWYDITASEEYLTVLDPEEAKGKYDATANSAQPHPSKQGA